MATAMRRCSAAVMRPPTHASVIPHPSQHTHPRLDTAEEGSDDGDAAEGDSDDGGEDDTADASSSAPAHLCAAHEEARQWTDDGII